MKRVALTRPVRQGLPYVKKSNSKELRESSTTPHPPPLGGRGVGGLPTAEQVVEKKSVDELVLLAGLLNPSQQKELLARLSLTNQTLASGEVRDVDMWATALHDSLVSSVGGSGEGVAGPAVIKRLVASPSAWVPVSSFMKASTLAELNVTERQAAYMMLARLVIDNARGVAKHSRIPLTTKMVINCSSNITGIFQQSFPGYIESGLAKLVVRRMNAH